MTGNGKERRAGSLLIGDAIHVLNPRLREAVRNRQEADLVDIARRQLSRGADALAVNLGAGRAFSSAIPWVVETLRQETRGPLFLSASVMDHPEVLRKEGSSLVINAVTADPDDMRRGMESAAKYGCALTVLLVRSGRIRGGVEGKLELGVEALLMAGEIGLPSSRLYLDPVLTARTDPNAWRLGRGVPDVGAVVDTISLLHETGTGVKTLVALGNGTEGMKGKRKSSLQAGMLSLFGEAGVDAVLLSCLDGIGMRAAA
ncbi:MAG: hypothetical protein Kow0089_02830 [Desulfobulbaceae bacterium]